jgi:predicted outer membrane repeat protein
VQAGGAVKVLNGGGFGCRRCRFVTNGASEHGGAIFADDSLLMLRDSLFQGTHHICSSQIR